MPREYDSDEVAAIFERAAAAEHTAAPAPADGKGLTLAALQDIGREVGISADSIAEAARSLDHVRESVPARFMGLPIGVGRVVEFDRPLTDAEWEGLVADLRTTFQARGAVRYDGPFRQWTNGNLQALLEPTPTGHRLRLQTRNGMSRQRMTAGAAVTVVSLVGFIKIAATAGLARPGGLVGIGVIGLMGVGMLATGALRLPGWARRRKEQFDEIIARLGKAVGT